MTVRDVDHDGELLSDSSMVAVWVLEGEREVESVREGVPLAPSQVTERVEVLL